MPSSRSRSGGKKKPAARKKRPAARKKKPAARKKRPASTAARRSRPRRPAGSGKGRKPAPRNWRRWLLTEALVVALGVTTGLGVTGGFLWSRAVGDVEAYLANPPRTWPSVVYTAPLRPRDGQPATVAALTGELLSAGYEKVPAAAAPNQFALRGSTLDVWVAAESFAGIQVEEQLVTLEVADGRITSVEPPDAVLRPAVLATIGDLEGRRTDVDLATLSPWVEPAVLAMEDARFRSHRGIDPLGIARALAHNLLTNGGLHGGSTLTQQLAKNLFLSSERTLQRKVREAFFAAAIEAHLTKDEILELYLGEVYLGQVGGVPLYGVDQAAHAWFGVSASSLDLGQSATIAGVISAPNRYSPSRHPERAQERRDLVLERMVTVGAIPREQADAAIARAMVVDGQLPGAIRRAPWAVDVAVDAAEHALGEGALSSHGYGIHTTLDPLLQRAAEAAVTEGLTEVDAAHPDSAGAEAALVAVRVDDGAVVALVGGRDYAASPFNRAVHAWRQAGSTVKPLTTLAAMDRDPQLTPLSRLTDEPISRRVDGTTWTPSNYDGRFAGELTLRQALEGSRNIPAVLVAESVGYTRLQRHLRDLGLSRATQLPSVSLGAFDTTPWEMAGAYTALADLGQLHRPWLLREVREPGGALTLSWEGESSRVGEARSAAMVTAMLEGVITHGTGRHASRYGVHGPAAGKTGTTDDYRDAWFVGYTPELVVAVWVGRDRGSLGLTGSQAALPIWARFAVASGTLHGRFDRPEGLTLREVCTESHRLARPSCPLTYDEFLPEDAIPDDKCDIHGGPVVEGGRFLQRLFGRER